MFQAPLVLLMSGRKQQVPRFDPTTADAPALWREAIKVKAKIARATTAASNLDDRIRTIPSVWVGRLFYNHVSISTTVFGRFKAILQNTSCTPLNFMEW